MNSPTLDALRWHKTPAGQALGDADLDLQAHIDAGRAAIVKHGEHRTVYRVTLATGVAYFKHCRLNGSRAWWREVLRGPKAWLECERQVELARRGIDTVEPLAWGRFDGRWPRGSILVTRGLDGAVPLDEFLSERSFAASERRTLIISLAKFIRQLHDAGVTHPDIHPGNILIRFDGPVAKFHLIDVHDVLLGEPLRDSARRANLVLLNRWFQLRTSRTDRLRFWLAYGGERETVRMIESATDQSNVRLWSSRRGRCLRNNRQFQRVKAPGLDGHAVRELRDDALTSFLADPDEPFNRPGPKLKDSRSSTVCEINVAGRPMIYKRFMVTHATDPWVNLVRPDPAMRSWLNGHALIDRGLPTPRQWLVLHRTSFGRPTVGYLLCEKVEAATDLHLAVKSADLIDHLARLIRLMHDRAVSHRDLKAANILVDSAGAIHFIDLVGVRMGRLVPQRTRLRDLTRLNASFVRSPNVTRTDRLRFLRTYLMWGLRGRAGWKDLWRAIARLTEAKIAKNARRSRPLA